MNTDKPWTRDEIEAAMNEFEEKGPRIGLPTELQDDVTWADYRDYEKREMAFGAGANWALNMMRSKGLLK